MTDQFPPPLTPPDCDLRDFPFMALDVVRLRDSDIAADPDAEVFRAAVLSWCASWHQVPAASLPDDDAAISRLIGMGRDVKGFRKLRAGGALRGFVLCDDGRLYHRVVAEKAVEAWERKKAQRDRTEKARTARLSQRLSQTPESSVTDNVTTSVVSGTKASKGQGQGEDRDKASLRSEPTVGQTHSAGAGPAEEPKFSLQSQRSEPVLAKAKLPPFVPVDAWAAFVDMRRRIRAPLTARAVELMIRKLEKLHSQGEDIAAVLDQSILKSWRDVFPVKHDNGGRNGSGSSNRQQSGASTAHQRHLEGWALLVDEAERAEEEPGRPGFSEGPARLAG